MTNLQEKLSVDEALQALVTEACAVTYELAGPRDDGTLPAAEVSITFMDDAGIQELNREHRGIDEPTDVLSFAMGEGELFPHSEELALPLGDIIISLERAWVQSQEYGHSFTREVAFLTVHGMCHLLGYDHLTETERQEMRQMEEKVLARLGQKRE